MSKVFKSAGFPAITLNNGLTVVNYSSPHPYTFDTGEVLPACDADLVRKHSLIEEHEESKNSNGWIDVRIKDEIQNIQLESLAMIARDPNVDVILVPFRVQCALRDLVLWGDEHRDVIFDVLDNQLLNQKIRVCRIEDRINKLVSSTKFCK
tara:strand:+ start:199 stop:651 length:453 start_codon:yes stop_codon:yes gene_type:complete